MAVVVLPSPPRHSSRRPTEAPPAVQYQPQRAILLGRERVGAVRLTRCSSISSMILQFGAWLSCPRSDDSFRNAGRVRVGGSTRVVRCRPRGRSVSRECLGTGGSLAAEFRRHSSAGTDRIVRACACAGSTTSRSLGHYGGLSAGAVPPLLLTWRVSPAACPLLLRLFEGLEELAHGLTDRGRSRATSGTVCPENSTGLRIAGPASRRATPLRDRPLAADSERAGPRATLPLPSRTFRLLFQVRDRLLTMPWSILRFRSA